MWPFFGTEAIYWAADRWQIQCYQLTQASQVGVPGPVGPSPPDTEGSFECGDGSTCPGFGYGDVFTAGDCSPGGYGDHGAGYGHPCGLVAVGVVGGRDRHDLGGEQVVMVSEPGYFPDGPLSVTINGVECYSGVSGSGNAVTPTSDLSSIAFVTPHQLDVSGDVDVLVTGPSAAVTIVAALNIVQHPGRSGVLFVSGRCDPSVNLLPTYRPRY